MRNACQEKTIVTAELGIVSAAGTEDNGAIVLVLMEDRALVGDCSVCWVWLMELS